MCLHQIATEKAQTVWCRVISCFCKRESFCTCFNIAKVKFSTPASVLPKQWLPLSNDVTKAVRYLFLSCLLIRLGYRNTVVNIMQKNRNCYCTFKHNRHSGEGERDASWRPTGPANSVPGLWALEKVMTRAVIVIYHRIAVLLLKRATRHVLFTDNIKTEACQ